MALLKMIRLIGGKGPTTNVLVRNAGVRYNYFWAIDWYISVEAGCDVLPYLIIVL